MFFVGKFKKKVISTENKSDLYVTVIFASIKGPQTQKNKYNLQHFPRIFFFEYISKMYFKLRLIALKGYTFFCSKLVGLGKNCINVF